MLLTELLHCCITPVAVAMAILQLHIQCMDAPHYEQRLDASSSSTEQHQVLHSSSRAAGQQEATYLVNDG